MAELSYVLALDGGQSSTICVLGTTDGTVLSAGRGGAMNRPFQPDGPERVRRALTSAIGEALAPLPAASRRLAAAYLALTGGIDVAMRIVPTIVAAERLLVEGDVIAALASGTYGGPGIGLIAGTGVCALAETATGVRLWRGGWGYVLGDEGGGYWIGMQALRAAARAEDGRGPLTPLYSQILQQWDARDMRAVFKRLYASEIDQPEIARLAPLVLDGADAGDPVAVGIVDEAAEELSLLVEVTAAAAAFTDEHERVIVATGGVLRRGNALWQRFAQRIARRLPEFRLIAPRFPPVVGAYLLGLRLAGVRMTEDVLSRVETSLAAVPDVVSKSAPISGQEGSIRERDVSTD